MTNTITFNNLIIKGIIPGGLPGAPWTLGTPIVVPGSTTYYMTVAALLNGGFMLAYEKGSGNPTYVRVYDDNGSPIGSEIQIANNTYGRVSIETLTNGNVVAAFGDQDDSNQAKFMILSPTGSTVKAITDVSPAAASTYGPPVVPLSNGGFMILYCVSSGSFQSVVYDSAGAEVNRPSAVSMDIYAGYFDARPIPGGGALVFVVDNSDVNTHYMILNTSGVVTHTELDISNGTYDQDYPCCAVLDNGNYFFAWYDDYTEGGGVYAIYDSNNSVVKAIAPMSGGHWNTFGGVITLSNGTVMAHVDHNRTWVEFYQEDGTFIEEHQLLSASSGSSGSVLHYCAQLTGGKIIATIPRSGVTDNEYILLTGTTYPQ
jgi:hypothetical protein